jgi:hypothetical protein
LGKNFNNKKKCIKTTFYQSNKISALNFVKLLFENRKNAKNEEKKKTIFESTFKASFFLLLLNF